MNTNLKIINRGQVPKTLGRVGWKKTLTGRYKWLFSESLKTGGAGGVVRNEERSWIIGFTIRAGFGLGIKIETWC